MFVGLHYRLIAIVLAIVLLSNLWVPSSVVCGDKVQDAGRVECRLYRKTGHSHLHVHADTQDQLL